MLSHLSKQAVVSLGSSAGRRTAWGTAAAPTPPPLCTGSHASHHDLLCTGSHALRPPRLHQGVILYGEPGTGKTLLAKAVANSTSATFLRVVGSELIQKYLGDGPKLVRELFRVAEESAPSIVFIGEHPCRGAPAACIGKKLLRAAAGAER